jgi:phosphoserine phosphatase RsbU/P
MGGLGADGRLRVLELVTDSALLDMDFEKLVNLLLRQVHDLFEVDTATVLLVDASGEQLVARASIGLDEEVFQGVRVPVGSGFAGRVAQLREPVLIGQVDESTVVNPLLWEHGLRVLVGVPIVAQGELIGVMHVGSTDPREFSGEEIELLQLVADRIAMAAHLYRSRIEQAAATVLVDSLLPATLPATDGWETAARYVAGAASGVGGDWYDVFPLPGDRLGVVIGDVVGKGLPAAIVMGRLRSALRAYALEFDDPAEVLGKLDRKASYFEHNTMATVAYAVIDTATHRVDLTLAGHPPPILAMPDQESAFVVGGLGPPVGYELATTNRRRVTLDVPPGGLLVFYTDGLVERRGTVLDERLELLRSTVRATAPEAVCARVMATMVGTQPATDDIALVAVRHTR